MHSPAFHCIARLCFTLRRKSIAAFTLSAVPPTSTDLSVFLRILRTNYGQKVKNTDAKSAPEGVASKLHTQAVMSTPKHCTHSAMEEEKAGGINHDRVRGGRKKKLRWIRALYGNITQNTEIAQLAYGLL